MTINGPAPMLLGFFLNAAIDQQCERYITEQWFRKRSSSITIKKIYKDKGCERPSYQGKLPEGNDGLGLMLLRCYVVIKFYLLLFIKKSKQKP